MKSLVMNSDTQIEDYKLGCGGNVVADLVTKAGVRPGSEIYMDNYFTSLPLLKHLSEKGIAGTGTMRFNRIQKAPIKSKKAIEKKDVARGTTDTVFSDDSICVGWKDIIMRITYLRI